MSFFTKKVDIDEYNTKFIGGPDKVLGVRLVSYSDEERSMSARFVVNEHCLQPYGLLHGGVSCLVAESIASIAGDSCVGENETIVGQSLMANHLRSAKMGDEVIAVAKNVHRGRRSHVWNVELNRKRDNAMISQVTLTLSVIPKN